MTDHEGVEGRLLGRISVAPPYFDLTDLVEVGDGIVNAAVPLAPTVAPEAGPVEGAQVARHLAILGSCAVALTRDDDQRHHYLATRAHYTRMANAPSTVDEPLRAQAIGSWVDRRTARALVTLSTEEGRALNLLDVQYTVLTPRMFHRLNPAIDLDEVDGVVAEARARADALVNANANANANVNANAAGPGPIPAVERIEGGVRVDAGPIPTEMCAGHFPGYPAAPVAIVMGKLCQAAGQAMFDHVAPAYAAPDGAGLRYRIEEGHVAATGLARAGQRLVLEASYVKPVRGGHQMVGRALADGEVTGEVRVIMSVHGPALQAGRSGVEDDVYRDALVDDALVDDVLVDDALVDDARAGVDRYGGDGQSAGAERMGV